MQIKIIPNGNNWEAWVDGELVVSHPKKEGVIIFLKTRYDYDA